jgi:uncharacterized protein YciI
MIKVLTLLIAIGISMGCYSQNNPREFIYNEGDTTFTMKRYVFGLLMSGENRSHDSLAVAEIQQGHMAHINNMAKTGKLVMAGPFENGGEYRGILLFDVETLNEAIELASKDPAVVAGRLRLEVIQWWGAKGTCLP